jgi:hypothetical protein
MPLGRWCPVGSEGSGNFGHEGRPGERGGSVRNPWTWELLLVLLANLRKKAKGIVDKTKPLSDGAMKDILQGTGRTDVENARRRLWKYFSVYRRDGNHFGVHKYELHKAMKNRTHTPYLSEETVAIQSLKGKDDPRLPEMALRMGRSQDDIRERFEIQQRGHKSPGLPEFQTAQPEQSFTKTRRRKSNRKAFQKWTDEERMKMDAFRAQGYTWRYIAGKTGRSSKACSQEASRMKRQPIKPLEPTPPSQPSTEEKDELEFTPNPDFQYQGTSPSQLRRVLTQIVGLSQYALEQLENYIEHRFYDLT